MIFRVVAIYGHKVSLDSLTMYLVYTTKQIHIIILHHYSLALGICGSKCTSDNKMCLYTERKSLLNLFFQFALYVTVFYLFRYCFCWERVVYHLLEKTVKRGEGKGAEECPPPQTFLSGNFCWPTGQGKKGKMEKNRRKTEKGRWKIENHKEKWKWGEDLFTFQSYWNLFWVYQNRNFILFDKKHSTPGKKSGKWLCPLWKIFLLRPWRQSFWFFIAVYLSSVPCDNYQLLSLALIVGYLAQFDKS